MNVSEGPVQLAPAEYRAAETESGGHRGESKENNHDVLFFFFFSETESPVSLRLGF